VGSQANIVELPHLSDGAYRDLIVARRGSASTARPAAGDGSHSEHARPQPPSVKRGSLDVCKCMSLCENW
jgi:hypothetical protein